jgi:hypothetical protein
VTHEEEVAAYAHRIIRLRDGYGRKRYKQIALLRVASAYSAIPHSFKEKVKIQAYYLLCCTSSNCTI